MDRSDIESFAVDKIRECLRRCDLLDANNINIGDKEPSWDGFVYLYKNKNHSKCNIEKRLPVQVKGTEQEDLSKKQINFNVEKSDLQNYYNDGGAIFFVVYIKDYDNYKIYYETLTKIKLHGYLRICEKNNYASISITLTELPRQNLDEVTDVFTNFSKDYNQNLPKKDYTLEEILNNGIKEYKQFKVSYHGIAYKNNPMSYFMTHPTTIYVESEGDGPDIAVAVGQLASIGQKQNLPVYIGDTKYYEKFQTEETVSEGKMYFGKSFIITFDKNNRQINFHWQIKGNLTQRITDTTFLLSFFHSSEFSIDGQKMTFPIPEGKVTKKDIEYYEQNLRFLKAVKDILDFFGVRKELDYDSVTAKDEETLLFLIDQVFNKKKYKNEQKEAIVLQAVKVANISFLIEIVKVSEDECEIRNFFKETFNIIYTSKDDSSISFTASPLLMLQEDQFFEFSNIDYDVLYSSLLETELKPEFLEYFILYTLSMLKAYDRQIEKDSEILNCLLKIYDYLLTTDSSNELYLLNRFQVIKRQRELTENEKRVLFKIIETTNMKPNKTAAFLLYGDLLQAKYYYEQLTQDEQTMFDSYPINIFWKQNV